MRRILAGKPVGVIGRIDVIHAGRIVRADDWHAISDVFEDGLREFV